ncbi:MAG TPA: bifunctional ADP-heptose synthase [Anaerolineales bacterium]|nr:bifunctional ADP-heptose synthase [Anaerolineales bacterium]
MNPLETVLDTLFGQSLVVLGDVFLDEYLLGRAQRLSREAPVPVLEYRGRSHLAGGGANPAVNAAALGAKVRLIGVVGDDPEAATLRGLLTGAGVDVSGLITDAGRPTILKTRIMAEGELRFPQQLARIDRLSRLPLDPAIESNAITALRRLTLGAKASAILISDYRSGLVSPAVVEAAHDLARERSLILAADAQGELDKYHGFTLVKCNRAEAESFLGRQLGNDDDTANALAALGERLNIGCALITRGSRGISIGIKGAGCTHIAAANVSEVYDVTGAGDTVIAVATLALCAGADPESAARLANIAAGIVVRRWGNAVVTRDELLAHVRAANRD